MPTRKVFFHYKIKDIAVSVYRDDILDYVKFKASNSQGLRNLYVTVGMDSEVCFVRFLIDRLKPKIKNVFLELDVTGVKSRKWIETGKYLSYRGIYENHVEQNRKRKLEQEQTERLHLHLEEELNAEKQRIEAERLPDKYEIDAVVKTEKCKHFSNIFVCKLCKRKHSTGYTYLIRGHEVNVCSYCRTDIRRTKPFVKIISTNMGHGKKS